ncbi:MAG TPA: helix-turn-helix transcriptional regulator [Longimicrobiales bacterium]|nr:helix-turn-helix transcriptional regulator [Longimicrobiales bacterium]
MAPRTTITFASGVLLDAIGRGVRHGFSLMDATGLPDGTVYPALRRMEGNGWLASRWEDEDEAHAQGRPARRYYELTAEGRRALARARERFPGLARMAPPPGAVPSGDAS